MCSAESGVKSAADFKGKTIGVTDLGSGTDELTQFLAAKPASTRTQYHTLAVGRRLHRDRRHPARQRRLRHDDPADGRRPHVAEARDHGRRPGHDGRRHQGARRRTGRRPVCSRNASWVKAHEDAAQKVGGRARGDDALDQHPLGAQDIADKLPPDFVQNSHDHQGSSTSTG